VNIVEVRTGRSEYRDYPFMKRLQASNFAVWQGREVALRVCVVSQVTGEAASHQCNYEPSDADEKDCTLQPGGTQREHRSKHLNGKRKEQ
jgi:hypothetical protein